VPNPRLRAIQEYLKQIGKDLARGDSTEHTHRPALQALIQQLQKGIVCVNEPKGSSAACHPDMKVLLGETPLGFIETKDVGLDLSEIAETPQLKRYLAHISNLILTDYLEFRWYQNGNLADTVRLATPAVSGKLRRDEKGGEALLTLLDNFLTADVKTVGSPKELAQRMATLAKWVRRVIVEAFEAESAGQELHSQLKAFREVLLPDLDVPKFADMYAQTICYGLFAGKCNADPGITFARDNAASYLPRTNPFLRKLFSSIMAGDLNEKVAGAIDAITFLLDHSDIASILRDFGKRTRQEDPVVHFYETFLAAYDPKLRKSRGVYYTPEPVVSYIVRSVDWLLKEKFGKKEGLADPSVLVLDPACGTGTFLYHVIKLIHERVQAKGQYGSWSGYVRDHLLPRVFGFELLMAPYAVAHLKLGLLLQDTGYDFGSDERLGIYLTNTLEEAAKKSDVLFAQYISDEANAATDIKRDKPIMVVLGNPPYSNFGMMNRGGWIRGLLADYKKGLHEKKLNLDDDYIKFIRWGHWRVDRTGHGILAFISNNSYVDGVTHRRMRQSLMESFNDIHILDLHGSSKKKETSPDGSKDENVFDIQQGVAIGIFARASLASSEKDVPASLGSMNAPSVRHSDLFGLRDEKYEYLARQDASDSEWTTARSVAPGFLFEPRARVLDEDWNHLVDVTRAFAVWGSGLNTDRDDLFLDFDRDALEQRMRTLFSGKYDDDFRSCYRVHPSSSYDVQERVAHSQFDRACLRQCIYRPYDTREIYYSPGVTSRPVYEVQGHMLRRNVAVLLARQSKEPFAALATRLLSTHKIVTVYDRSSIFPLYQYQLDQRGGQQRLDSTEASPWPGWKDGRVPNLTPKFVAEMEQKLGLKFAPEGAEGSLECGSDAAALPPSLPTGKAGAALPQSKGVFTPEDVFHYIYAAFHSPTYRKRYAEFLKIDFPRVPLTSDKKLFWKLVELGRKLVALHLLESLEVDFLETTYPKKGSDVVENVRYVEPGVLLATVVPGAHHSAKSKGRVYINSEQYFDGVKPEWFEFHIGGYQVLQKWLKDRKGRRLTHDDIIHYQRVVVAIKETIRLMSEIDKAIPKWPIE